MYITFFKNDKICNADNCGNALSVCEKDPFPCTLFSCITFQQQNYTLTDDSLEAAISKRRVTCYTALYTSLEERKFCIGKHNGHYD